jgi:hypothetical protein
MIQKIVTWHGVFQQLKTISRQIHPVFRQQLSRVFYHDLVGLGRYAFAIYKITPIISSHAHAIISVE